MWVERTRVSLDDGVLLGQFSISQLVDSAATQCHLCTLLLEALCPEKALIGIEEQPEDLCWNQELRYQVQMLPDWADVLAGVHPLDIQHHFSSNLVLPSQELEVLDRNYIIRSSWKSYV